MMDIYVDLLPWFINFLIKKLQAEQLKNENISNTELAEELHKQIFRKFKKRKEHSTLIYNIQGADLVDMQLIRKFHQGYVQLPFIANMHGLFLYKIKKGITITNTFQKFLIKQKSNQINNGQKKAVNFIIDQ